MINIVDKNRCCGCTACYSICPKRCIKMTLDKEGFYYPIVDEKNCIDCGLCNKVCFFNEEINSGKMEQSLYIAIQNKDEKQRESSTAGGAFSLIADYILDNNGIVYAVGYDEKMMVCHQKCEYKSDISRLSGSKYVQSFLGDTFRYIKENLKNKTKILFVGTPCQVHGLKNYIGENEYLYTIDLLCLGVSSPHLYKKWIEYLEKKYELEIINIEFRNKRFGYATPNVRVSFKNGKAIDQTYDSKVHANLFFKNYNVRPSCYECEYRNKARVSDFTLGDFTEINKINSSMDDDKGTTKMWIHTDKGKILFNEICSYANFYIIDYQCSNIIGGPKIQISTPKDRNDFFKDVYEMDYYSLVTKWEPKTLKSDIIGIARKLINKLPFKSYIFKKMRYYNLRKFQKNVIDINKKKQRKQV